MQPGPYNDQFPKSKLSLLGSLFLEKMPAEAAQLISAYIPNVQPKEEDFSKIEDYYKKFCQVQGLSAKQYSGPLFKSNKIEIRRLFIAVMLHLYNPQVYLQPVESITTSMGFGTSIAKALDMDTGNVSRMIREVIRWEKSYDDFQSKVTDLMDKVFIAG